MLYTDLILTTFLSPDKGFAISNVNTDSPHLLRRACSKITVKLIKGKGKTPANRNQRPKKKPTNVDQNRRKIKKPAKITEANTSKPKRGRVIELSNQRRELLSCDVTDELANDQNYISQKWERGDKFSISNANGELIVVMWTGTYIVSDRQLEFPSPSPRA